jgi:hypothetical protein
MICDDVRPCSRCIKRNIGHLCHDEPVSQRQKLKLETKNSQSVETPQQTPLASAAATTTTANEPAVPTEPLQVENVPHHLQQPFPEQTTQQISNRVPTQGSNTNLNRNVNVFDPFLNFNQQPFFFSEHAGSEFSSLNEFLSVLDDPQLITGADNLGAANLPGNDQGVANQNQNQQQSGVQQPQNNQLSASHSLTNLSLGNFSVFNSPSISYASLQQFQNSQPPLPPASTSNSNNLQTQTSANQSGQQNQNGPSQPNVSDSARDKFFLTAADPSTEISPEERLKQVINAKLEAGLLHPYNYAKGYARLQGYMDNYMNHQSKRRILKPLSIFRPAFRAIARTLNDVDLILVEENFERMLLDYDRVFTSMAIPACLWRRTGEIYRGNKEFASLVEVNADDLRDGKLAIYELMSEESAVNFWEKYGAIAFDKGQKAVLTSCNLRTRDGRRRKTCCFSFTIRRDRYNIPSCIVGNFIPINP